MANSDSRVTQVRRSVLSGLAALVAGAGLAFLVVVPAAAECDGRIPPFRQYADTAKRIVIGTVTGIEPNTGDSLGRSTHFTLRVTDVLRGPAVRTMAIRGMAFLDCADHDIWAAEGERIALAIDAHGFTPPITFVTMAWIRAVAQVEPEYRITEAEVIALVGRAPDTDAAQPDLTRRTDAIAVPTLVLGALTGIVAWSVRTRRRQARSSPGLPQR